ncbi:MAG: hypothetical protein EBQ95_04055 [Gammaproteobacteria bacterium]|nr:hypothetical protein [Gammaproteobacteria bacterium]
MTCDEICVTLKLRGIYTIFTHLEQTFSHFILVNHLKFLFLYFRLYDIDAAFVKQGQMLADNHLHHNHFNQFVSFYKNNCKTKFYSSLVNN